MKKLLFATCCIALLGGSLEASAQKKSAAKNVLIQTLEGKSWSADNGNGTFTNPLFYDEFSDPDIIRVGGGLLSGGYHDAQCSGTGGAAFQGFGELGILFLLLRPIR